MSVAKRNVGIDLFRCVLVYGICAYHAFYCGEYASGSMSRLWTWCVPAFAFVSGYYGVRFRMSKLLHLYVIALLCFSVPMYLGGGLHELFAQCWYLHAYALLLLISPLLNSALSTMVAHGNWQWLWGALGIGIWSWLTELVVVRDYVPRPNGLGALSFTSLFVAYVFGFVYHSQPQIAKKLKAWWMLFFVPAMALLGHYTSPVTLIVVALLFAIFEKLPINGRLGRWVSCISSSGLAVYLLHANWQVIPKMNKLSSFIIEDCGLCAPLGLMLSAAVVYAGCVALYLLAQLVFWPIRKFYLVVLELIDRQCARFALYLGEVV